MGYKPTLGGLKKAQDFLNLKGYPMPIFQMDTWWPPGKGPKISIDEAIRKHGAACEVVDVRLANEQGEFVQFSSTSQVGMFTGLEATMNGWDVIVEFHKGDYQFEDFMNSADGTAFVNLARWGKATVPMLDRIKFLFLP